MFISGGSLAVCRSVGEGREEEGREYGVVGGRGV